MSVFSKIYLCRTKIQGIDSVRNLRLITPNVTSIVHNTPFSVISSSVDHYINVHAMLTVFYISSGGSDVYSVMSMFGIKGGHNWERTSHRQSKYVHRCVMNNCSSILQEELLDEVEATIEIR